MALRIGQIKGFKTSMAKVKGFAQVIDFGNPEYISKIPKKETTRSCKPLVAECEFCKEKLGLLNDDVFVKSDKNL